MPAYGFGDVVLVPFPFTDLSGAKKRPAVIVSGAAYNEARRDAVIMAVTSQLNSSGMFGEVIIQDWQAASLLKPSAIKPVFGDYRADAYPQALGSTFYSRPAGIVRRRSRYHRLKRNLRVVAVRPGVSTRQIRNLFPKRMV